MPFGFVPENAERLGLRQPQASKHLRILLESGIVAVTADALCTLTRQLVTTPNDANAFCVKLSDGQVNAYQNAMMAASGKSVTPANARVQAESRSRFPLARE